MRMHLKTEGKINKIAVHIFSYSCHLGSQNSECKSLQYIFPWGIPLLLVTKNFSHGPWELTNEVVTAIWEVFHMHGYKNQATCMTTNLKVRKHSITGMCFMMQLLNCSATSSPQEQQKSTLELLNSSTYFLQKPPTY